MLDCHWCVFCLQTSSIFPLSVRVESIWILARNLSVGDAVSSPMWEHYKNITNNIGMDKLTVAERVRSCSCSSVPTLAAIGSVWASLFWTLGVVDVSTLSSWEADLANGFRCPPTEPIFPFAVSRLVFGRILEPPGWNNTWAVNFRRTLLAS